MGDSLAPTEPAEWGRLRESLVRIQEATSHLVSIYSAQEASEAEVCHSAHAAASASTAAAVTLGLTLALAFVLLLQTVASAFRARGNSATGSDAQNYGPSAGGSGGGGRRREAMLMRLPSLISGVVIGLLAGRERTGALIKGKEVAYTHAPASVVLPRADSFQAPRLPCAYDRSSGLRRPIHSAKVFDRQPVLSA